MYCITLKIPSIIMATFPHILLMKRTSALLIAPLLFLSACAAHQTQTMTLDDQLQNPLFALRYYEDLTEQMVSLQLRNDPILKDGGKKSTVESTRVRATKLAQDAVDVVNANLRGDIISDADLSLGRASLIGKNVYFGTDFVATPGPSLHVYVSNALDPRLERFPDKTAVDLGLLKNPYGAQTMDIPETTEGATYRTIVLWDNSLGRIYGFVQLKK